MTLNKAYNIAFKNNINNMAHPYYSSAAKNEESKVLIDENLAPAGWVGIDGPNIPWEEWPREPTTGLSMLHGITISVPVEYRTEGDEYVALSVFQGPDVAESSTIHLKSNEFMVDFLARREREKTFILKDDYGYTFAIMWLKANEVFPKKAHDSLLESDNKEFSEISQWGEWGMAEIGLKPPENIPVWILPRLDDPNIGITPNEEELNGYIKGYSLEEEDFDRLSGWCHFGGTMFDVQGVPENYSPYYLEIEDLDIFNLGDAGTAQIDLKNRKIEWACG